MIKKILLWSLFMFGMFFTTSNLSVDAYGWGFTRNSEHKTPYIGKYRDELAGTSSYYIGDESKKEVFLTFDAGYDNGEMAQILDILYEYDVKATFFVTGDFVKRFPELTIRMTYDGHVVANHTMNHSNITNLSCNELEKELTSLEKSYFDLTGKIMPKYVRPPSGLFDHKSLTNLTDLGYKTIFWSIAYCDWNVKGQKSIDYTTNMVLNNLHNGAIVLLHSVSSSNREALPLIIEGVRNNGYTFKTVLAL